MQLTPRKCAFGMAAMTAPAALERIMALLDRDLREYATVGRILLALE